MPRRFARRFLLSYLRLACFIIGFGCLLAAANVGRLALQWRGSADSSAILAGVLAIVFIAAGGAFILLGVRAPWRPRLGRD